MEEEARKRHRPFLTRRPVVTEGVIVSL
jgi:hypothetical protein